MTAAKYDLICEQGCDFLKTITVTDSNGAIFNLTGYAAKMQVKTKIDGDIIIELSTVNSRISIDAVYGIISLTLSNELTEDLPPADVYLPTKTVNEGVDNFGNQISATGPFGVYDLEITSAGGRVTRLLRGDFCMSKQVTT